MTRNKSRKSLYPRFVVEAVASYGRIQYMWVLQDYKGDEVMQSAQEYTTRRAARVGIQRFVRLVNLANDAADI